MPPTIVRDYQQQLIQTILNLSRQQNWWSSPINLGGGSGPDGGSGVPIGDIFGQLIQSKIAFDTTEAENLNIPVSGASLLHNLNRIRFRLLTVEASGIGASGIIIQHDDVLVDSDVTTLNFEGSGVTDVATEGPNKVTVTISVSGGSEPHTLGSSTHTDVVITTPADNEVLAYDSGGGDWINQTPSEASLSPVGHTHIETDITDLSHAIEVQEDDATKVSAATILNFEGGVDVVDEGGGKATITVSGGSGADEKAKVSANDTTTDFLEQKIVAGSNVNITVLNEGANEQLEISSTASGGGGSAIEVFDEGTSLTTDVTSLDFVGGSVEATAIGNAVTVTISGTGSGGGVPDADFTMWMPDAPPPSGYLFLGTQDDEFDDSSFDTGIWSEFDVPATQTVVEADYGVYMTTTTVNNMQGIFQPVPNGQSDWSFTTYVGPTHGQVGDQKPGILLIQDIDNLDTSDCYLWVNFRGGSGYGWQAIFHTQYNIFSADDFNVTSDVRPAGMFLRFRLSGTTWHFDWSEDGYHWVNDRFTRTERFTIEGIGIGQRVGTPSNWHAPFKFARFLNSSNKDQMLGARVRGWHE